MPEVLLFKQGFVHFLNPLAHNQRNFNFHNESKLYSFVLFSVRQAVASNVLILSSRIKQAQSSTNLDVESFKVGYMRLKPGDHIVSSSDNYLILKTLGLDVPTGCHNTDTLFLKYIRSQNSRLLSAFSLSIIPSTPPMTTATGKKN